MPENPAFRDIYEGTKVTTGAPQAVRAAIVVVAALLSGCALVNQMTPGKRAAQQRAQQLQSLQLGVMRFADEYVGRTEEAMNRFQAGAVSPEERLAAQNWKVKQATAVYTFASGPNPIGNAIDLVVLASLSRMVIDDAWVGGSLGVRAKSVQQTYQAVESEAWRLLARVLTPEQLTQLRELIDRWRAGHPTMHDVTYIHFREFAASVGAPMSDETAHAGSLFAMLGIDPFSDLDPAVREIALSRGLAERSIFYMQHVPNLVDMQVQRMTFQLAVMPETRALLGDLDRASLVGSAADQLVRQLPDILDRQREALLAQLGRTLSERSKTVGATADELRTTLQAGTETADAIQRMLETLGRLTTQFAPKGAAPASEQKLPSFDIRQYTEMLREATAAARELDALAQRADSSLPGVHAATQDMAASLQRVLDHAFLLLLLLLLAATSAIFLAVIGYRWIVPSLDSRNGALGRAA